MIPLALPTVAALTPDHYDIRIVDEEIEKIPDRHLPDIVGISALAATVTRGYEIADAYRAKGVRVVMGGPYASFMTKEVLAHCDSVVVGEAEGLWEECLSDFENGLMKPVYSREDCVPYLRQSPPRWDMVSMKKIFQVAIHVSRGCPFDCDFCLVSKMFGRKMRYREIGNVVEEILAAPSKYFFFVDDNLTINKRYAKELMRAIIPLKISWGCMCSIDVADDPELLDLMAQAGCFNILIGFESLNPGSLEESRKRHNKSATIYENAIRKIDGAGIHINASFVVGFDHDTLEEFRNIYDFTLKMSIPNVNLHILNAPPGSETYERYKAEGRLADCPPEIGVGHFPTLHYMNMSQTDLFDRYMATLAQLYSFRTIREKAVSLFSNGTFTRPGGKISGFLKARLTWITVKEFLFTADPEKRKLFFFILRLIRSKKIAIDKGLGFLLSMLGYNRHIREHRKNMDAYRKIVMQSDKGPWRAMSNNSKPDPGKNE